MNRRERYERDKAIRRLLRANPGESRDLARRLIDAVYPRPETIGYLPFRPLWGQLCLSFGEPIGSTIRQVHAERLGVHIETLQRWAAQDGIPPASADRVSTALNLNPVHLWGDDWDRAA